MPYAYIQFAEFSEADKKRLHAKINKNGPIVRPELGPCWVWTGRTNSDGYGRFSYKFNGKWGQILAHRATWFESSGSLGNEHVCHSCDNPPCCNPSHLFVGTQKDNLADMRKKGRANDPKGDLNGNRKHPDRRAKGERNFNSRLTDKVVEIRKLCENSGKSDSAIGRMFGVSPTAIVNVKRRLTWAHIP